MIKNFFKDESANAMLEEALILALICLGASWALASVGYAIIEPLATVAGKLKGLTVIDKHPGGAL
jgi:Flp pilus assembly pilin Flp